MTKPKSKSKPSSARKSGKRKTTGKPTTPLSPAAPRAETKHARIVAMLRAPKGTTIDAIVTATGWQQHSVRGFLAGVVRKKLGLDLVSEVNDRGRVYRIKDRKSRDIGSQGASPAA